MERERSAISKLSATHVAAYLYLFIFSFVILILTVISRTPPHIGSISSSRVVSFHYARDPNGPWHKISANITDPLGVGLTEDFAFDTPFTHPNGSVFVVTASRTILRAEHWTGPYQVRHHTSLAPTVTVTVILTLTPLPLPFAHFHSRHGTHTSHRSCCREY